MLPNSMQGFSWGKKNHKRAELKVCYLNKIFFKVTTQVETIYVVAHNCKKKIK